MLPGTVPLGDDSASLFGAIGVLEALRHAQPTGRGQAVEVGIYDAVFRVLQQSAAARSEGRAQPARYRAFALSLHEMGLLGATRHKVADSGEQVLQRLTEVRPTASGALRSTTAQQAPAAL